MARHPSRECASKILEVLAAEYQKDARELTTAGQYYHNLTLTLLKTFPSGWMRQRLPFPTCLSKQKLDQALLDIGYKEKADAHAHSVAETLTFQGIRRLTEDAYRTHFDSRKEWPPSSHAQDV
jgi:hypothetical protein